MKQRDHFVVREQRRFALDRCGEIAREIRHRMLYCALHAAAVDRIVHPRTAAFGFARVQIKIELADQRAAFVAQIEKPRIGMPCFCVSRRDTQSVQFFDHPKQSLEHFRFGKILFNLLIRERVAPLPQFLGCVGDIPRVEFGKARKAQFRVRKIRQFGPVLLRERFGLCHHFAQEGNYFDWRFRHLGCERQTGIVFKTEQRGRLGAQRQYPVDDAAVVPFRLRAQLGGARRIGAIKTLTQRVRLRVLHHRQIAWRMQRELPARLALFFRRCARGRDHISGQTGQFRLVVDETRVRVGRIEHVVVEGRAQRRHFFLHGSEPRPLVRRQFRATQSKIAQRVVERLFLRLIKIGPCTIAA